MKSEMAALWPQVAPFFYASLAVFVVGAPVALLKLLFGEERRRNANKKHE